MRDFCLPERLANFGSIEDRAQPDRRTVADIR
jgi:hypothetical protein